MPMLADATRTAVLGTAHGMVNANELLPGLPRGPLSLDSCCRRRAFVDRAVALTALLLDKLGYEHLKYL